MYSREKKVSGERKGWYFKKMANKKERPSREKEKKLIQNT